MKPLIPAAAFIVLSAVVCALASYITAGTTLGWVMIGVTAWHTWNCVRIVTTLLALRKIDTQLRTIQARARYILALRAWGAIMASRRLDNLRLDSDDFLACERMLARHAVGVEQ